MVARLAEDLAVDHHGGVGGDHHRSRSTGGGRLLPSEAIDVVRRPLAGARGFVDVGRLDGELEREAVEQLAPAGRGGRENQPGRRHPPILATRDRSDTSRRRRARTVGAIDEHDDEERLLAPVPPNETDEDIRPDEFASTTGFLRSGTEDRRLPRYEEGPPWSYDEADARAHEFLAVLTTDRPVEHHDDPGGARPVEWADDLVRQGGERGVRHPAGPHAGTRVEAWVDLMSGGASSEAFGPLTLQEKLDEHQVDEALQAGRKQRMVNLVMAAVVAVVVVGGGIVAWTLLSGADDRTEGALQFDAGRRGPGRRIACRTARGRPRADRIARGARSSRLPPCEGKRRPRGAGS